MNDYKQKIIQLLDKAPESVSQWERTVFDSLAGDKKDRIVICGAGGLGRKTLGGLRQMGITPLAFADNNPKLTGSSIQGIPVFSAHEAAQKFGKDATFVVAIWHAHSRDRLEDRKQQWRDKGCETVVSFMSVFWKYAELLLPQYSSNLPHRTFAKAGEIVSLADLWGDDESRKEFLAQLRWRSELDFGGLPDPCTGTPYFPADLFSLLPDEQFVDCGAYDGDTLADFLRLTNGKFKKYWALEPDPVNFEKLKSAVASFDQEVQSRFELYALAACEQAQTLRFSADATAGSAVSDQGGIEVEGQSLDVLLAEQNPTFIKMDIEGAEPAALQGTAELLKRCRPILAICIYHLQEHLWEIPLWLKDRLKDYDFYLRSHDLEGWDLVCYAVPYERNLNRNGAKHQ